MSTISNNQWKKGNNLYPYEIVGNEVTKSTTTNLPKLYLEDPTKINFKVNEETLFRFKVEGKADNSWGGTKYDYVISSINEGVTISTIKFNAEKGWILKSKIKSTHTGKITLNIKVNNTFMNTIVLNCFNPKCLGNRDLSVEEVKRVVKLLRENTYYKAKDPKTKKDAQFPLTNLPYYSIDKIFHRNNLTGKFSNELVQDNSFDKFTLELNKIFNKYEINNCKRRRHFLAQIFIETAYFSQTVEADNSYTNNYDPYRGRGFIHLTHDYNYFKYKKDSKNDVYHFATYKTNNDDNSPESIVKIKKVSTDLHFAADVSGWYWKQGSTKGNINDIADTQTVREVTKAVNGGTNALDLREKAYDLLKTIFKDDEC